ncbi:MAG TPA: thioredoxin domain-containing protein [Polyangia bacterium]|nr:thioredoxin domain-containing protein [Polyangia bacterium]
MRRTLGLALALALTACGHTQRAAVTTASSPTVATVGGKAITLADVDHEAAQDLYEVRERTLNQMIDERVTAQAAEKAGQPRERFLRGLVEARAPQVTEAEAEAFFRQNRERMRPEFATKDFAEVKDRLIQGLTSERRRGAVEEVMRELRAQVGVKNTLEPPRIDVAATGPARGPASAKVTIIEFSDFQCPYCSQAKDVLEQVMKLYPTQVRLVFRDYPLSFHPNAAKAAEAGHCADEQGKFWEMHDSMFDHQDALTVPELEQQAKSLGLDAGRFSECLQSGKYAAAVAENFKAGQKAGVDGTPAFVINGVLVGGLQPVEEFRRRIDAALSR